MTKIIKLTVNQIDGYHFAMSPKKSKLYLFILKKKTTFIGCDLVKDYLVL